jgi:hypothetical protein
MKSVCFLILQIGTRADHGVATTVEAYMMFQVEVSVSINIP